MAQGLKRADRKFLVQMFYGPQACNYVKLSNVARALREGMALIKTETRLSRKIRREDWTSGINQGLIEQGARRIGADTVSAPDIADVGQPYSKKMDHLAEVRDGSTGEKRSARYRAVEVIGTQVEGAELVPLFGELYSQRAGVFLSENRQIGKGLDATVSQVGSRGIRTNRPKHYRTSAMVVSSIFLAM